MLVIVAYHQGFPSRLSHSASCTHTNKTLSLEKAAQCLNSSTKKPLCAHHLRHNDLTQVGIVANCDTLHGLSAAGGHEETDVSVSARSGGKITDLPDSPLPLPPPPLLLTVFCLGFCFVHHGGPYARVWTEAHDEGEGEGQGAGEERKEAVEGGDVPLGSRPPGQTLVGQERLGCSRDARRTR